MDNSEIRAKILRIHYDLEMNKPSTLFSIDELPSLMPGVPQNLLDTNVNYLYKYRLIEGIPTLGRITPVATRITPLGIDAVENPQRSSGEYSLNVTALSIGTNYGQVAQADRGATITQTQTYSSFNDLRQLVRSHTELTDGDKQKIEKVLAHLEEEAQKKGLTQKIIEEAKHAVAEYGWLIPPLLAVLAKAVGVG